MIVESLKKGLDKPIMDGIIKTFFSKKEAVKAGKEFGWNCAFKLERTFENVWIVGKKDFQPSYFAGIKYDQYNVPLLKWEKDSFGIQFCPVVQFHVKAKE